MWFILFFCISLILWIKIIQLELLQLILFEHHLENWDISRFWRKFMIAGSTLPRWLTWGWFCVLLPFLIAWIVYDLGIITTIISFKSPWGAWEVDALWTLEDDPSSITLFFDLVHVPLNGYIFLMVQLYL